MKKTIYIAPRTEVVNVKIESLLTNASINEDNPTGGLDDTPLKNGGDAPDKFSRRRSIWDED